MNSRFMRMTSRLLIASVLSLALPLQTSYAGMVETDKVAATAQSQTDHERIRTFLDREMCARKCRLKGLMPTPPKRVSQP